MSWAMRRRLIVFGIIAGVLALALTVFYFSSYYVGPSCTDNTQNQNEEGIDCGGSCTFVCTATVQAPSVRFVRSLTPTPGRTDVIAYIDNPNTDTAASDVHFTIELYSAANTVITKKDVVVDLPPASTVPVFVPNLFSGSQEVARAFITFDAPERLWYRYTDIRVLPQVVDVHIDEGSMPRITARATNASATKLSNIVFVVTVFDDAGNAIAASRTIAQTLPPQGSSPLVFTWTTPFVGAVSRVEVIPVVALPSAPIPHP